MYLHFNLRNAKCLKLSDAGSAAEFYWTWQIFTKHQNKMKITQGFSQGCPIDEGYSFNIGQQRKLNDPRFTIELPDINEGEHNKVSMNLYLWEGDFSTLEVKKVFTNQTANKLLDIYEKAQQKKEKTKEDFLSWFNNLNDSDFLKTVIASNPQVAAYIEGAKAVIHLLNWAVELVKTNSDDYIGIARIDLIYRKENGSYKYRWIYNNGVETWIDKEESPYFLSARFTEANNENEVDTKLIFQTVSEASKSLI